MKKANPHVSRNEVSDYYKTEGKPKILCGRRMIPSEEKIIHLHKIKLPF